MEILLNNKIWSKENYYELLNKCYIIKMGRILYLFKKSKVKVII